MKIEIKVPSMGESISDAVIGQILAPSGSIVKVDGEILELETDKVNQVLYAPQGGKIELTVKSGAKVNIGQSIGTIDTSVVPKETSTEKTSPPSLPPAAEKKQPAPESKPLPQKEEPLRYTQEAFLAGLNTVPPSRPAPPITITAPQLKPSSSRETRRPISRIRKVIAQRLVEGQHTMAMLTTFNEVDLTEVIRLRERYKEAFIKKYGCKLGFMSFFIKAAVSALQTFPDLNSYLDGDEIVHREYYDIGVAVGTDKGVIVPVVRNCNERSFDSIERAIENYAKKAREGTLAADDLQGGGFTITNGGTYGSLLSTPLLLPPQCAILGMHKIEKRPVVISDQITIRSMMYLALSYDHRLIDGKEAVSFLVHIKNILEEPSRLLLEV